MGEGAMRTRIGAAESVGIVMIGSALNGSRLNLIEVVNRLARNGWDDTIGPYGALSGLGWSRNCEGGERPANDKPQRPSDDAISRNRNKGTRQSRNLI